MAVSHISFNSNSEYGMQLRQALGFLERGKNEINDLLGVMATMIDGDGSQPAHYAYFVSRFGFSSNEDAQAAWNELQALMFKLNTEAGVDHVNAAMTQAFSKFG